MKRALLAITGVCWLLVVTAMAEEEAKPAVTARLVSLEVAIAEFHPSLWPADKPADGAKLLATLRSAEAQEKVFSLSQLQLSTLEHQAASMQFGERVAVPTGRMFAASSPGSRVGVPANATNYTRESLGTIVGATCRLDDVGLIVMELDVEQSRMAADTEVKLDPADPDASAMLKPVTRKVQTTLSVRDGETVVVSGMLHKAGKQLRQEVILLTARIAQPVPVKTSATARPASIGTIEDRVKSYAEKQIELYDKNEDGRLDAVEFSKFQRAPQNADRNKDGMVTAEELADAYSRRE